MARHGASRRVLGKGPCLVERAAAGEVAVRAARGVRVGVYGLCTAMGRGAGARRGHRMLAPSLSAAPARPAPGSRGGVRPELGMSEWQRVAAGASTAAVCGGTWQACAFDGRLSHFRGGCMGGHGLGQEGDVVAVRVSAPARVSRVRFAGAARWAGAAVTCEGGFLFKKSGPDGWLGLWAGVLCAWCAGMWVCVPAVCRVLVSSCHACCPPTPGSLSCVPLTLPGRYLSQDGLTGPVPSEIGLLTSLTFLYVHKCCSP